MSKKRLRIVNKFRFISCMVILFILISMGTGLLFKFNIAEGTEELKHIDIHIKSGDTLWDLAKKFTPNHKDVRKTIYEISAVNDLHTSDLYPGQVIKIPTP